MCAVRLHEVCRQIVPRSRHAVALSGVKLDVYLLVVLERKEAMVELRRHLLIDGDADEQLDGFLFVRGVGARKPEQAGSVLAHILKLFQLLESGSGNDSDNLFAVFLAVPFADKCLGLGKVEAVQDFNLATFRVNLHQVRARERLCVDAGNGLGPSGVALCFVETAGDRHRPNGDDGIASESSNSRAENGNGRDVFRVEQKFIDRLLHRLVSRDQCLRPACRAAQRIRSDVCADVEDG